MPAASAPDQRLNRDEARCPLLPEAPPRRAFFVAPCGPVRAAPGGPGAWAHPAHERPAVGHVWGNVGRPGRGDQAGGPQPTSVASNGECWPSTSEVPMETSTAAAKVRTT